MVKISFPTEHIELSLSDLEYAYLNYFCITTQRDSDEVLRAQVRNLTAEGVLAFQDWRSQQAKQQAPSTQLKPTTDTALADPVQESKAVAPAPEASNGSAPASVSVDALPVKPRSGRPPKQKMADPTPVSKPRRGGRTAKSL